MPTTARQLRLIQHATHCANRGGRTTIYFDTTTTLPSVPASRACSMEAAYLRSPSPAETWLGGGNTCGRGGKPMSSWMARRSSSTPMCVCARTTCPSPPCKGGSGRPEGAAGLERWTFPRTWTCALDWRMNTCNGLAVRCAICWILPDLVAPISYTKDLRLEIGLGRTPRLSPNLPLFHPLWLTLTPLGI